MYQSLNILTVWYMSIHPSTRPEREIKASSLSDNELKFSKSD
jgi:hypothetical protein